MRAYYLTADLMFSSRVTGVAERVQLPLRVVGTLEMFLQQAADDDDCPLVLIDLTLPRLNIAETVAAVKSRYPAARVVAYGPHVQEGLLAAASEAGCEEVLARGEFNARMDAILSKAAGRAP